MHTIREIFGHAVEFGIGHFGEYAYLFICAILLCRCAGHSPFKYEIPLFSFHLQNHSILPVVRLFRLRATAVAAVQDVCSHFNLFDLIL